ncbi:MAG: hypothetical protein HOP18_28020 [Deltaproteobacteria bacterium]|nr:hypothetical protein [Deltaproteobacteria bacterium]
MRVRILTATPLTVTTIPRALAGTEAKTPDIIAADTSIITGAKMDGGDRSTLFR